MKKSITLPVLPLPFVVLPEEVLPLKIFDTYAEAVLEYFIEMIDQGNSIPLFGAIFSPEGEPSDIGCAISLRKIVYGSPEIPEEIVFIARSRFRILHYENRDPLPRAVVEFFDEDALNPENQLRIQAITLHEKLIELASGQYTPFSLINSTSLSFNLASAAGFSEYQKQEFLQKNKEAERLQMLIEHYQKTIKRIIGRSELEGYLNEDHLLH